MSARAPYVGRISHSAHPQRHYSAIESAETTMTSIESSTAKNPLTVIDGEQPIVHLKPRVDPATLTHRQLKSGEFWQQIPAWKAVDPTTFISPQ